MLRSTEGQGLTGIEVGGNHAVEGCRKVLEWVGRGRRGYGRGVRHIGAEKYPMQVGGVYCRMRHGWKKGNALVRSVKGCGKRRNEGKAL